MAGRQRRDRLHLASPRTLVLIATALGASLLLAAATLTALAWTWGDRLAVQERLLPGVTIAGVDVGERTAAQALSEVLEAVEPRLERQLTVTYDGMAWRTTPSELGATTDAEEVVATAYDATTSASVIDLARIRWLGWAAIPPLEVTVVVPDDGLAFVDDIAATIDREPRDATIVWNDDRLELIADLDGRRVDRDRTLEALHDAANGRRASFEVPHVILEPEVSTALAERVLPEVRSTVDSALDREVTLTYDDTRWQVTARDLAAEPDPRPITAAALDAVHGTAAVVSPARADGTDRHGIGDLAVDLWIPDDRLEAFVDGLAGEIDRAPQDARIAWTGQGLHATPEEAGVALDRDTARARVESALRGASDRVALPVTPVAASVTTASFHRVLVVRQDLRELHLYVDGALVRDWPVAVGLGGSPTPTGVFTVGAKRHLPTWHNPDPNGWGRDMPRVIGPGPDNPLGVRALNWNRGGHDTLIRFHGTPNEASIGQAASRGCVRMFNRDVVELYDLIPSGTFIVSVAG